MFRVNEYRTGRHEAAVVAGGTVREQQSRIAPDREWRQAASARTGATRDLDMRRVAVSG